MAPTSRADRELRLRALATSGEQVSVRELIALWGAKGRGSQVRSQIGRNLREVGLATEPPFNYGSLDSTVKIVTLEDARSVARHLAERDPESRPADIEPDLGDAPETLHIGQIPSALAGLMSVTSTTTIGRAQTLMIQHDFSQLAVIDRELVGVVSWESIAQASLRGRVTKVSQCMTAPVTVARNADLLASIDLIVRASYVIVLDPAGKSTGIVTTADLAGQFDRIARPFLTVGECELELKHLLDRHFDKDTLHAATTYKRQEKPGATAMTIGDIKHFVKKDEVWAALNLKLSRDAFAEWIDVVRQLRNEVAHFNQDEESLSSLGQVRNLTTFLRALNDAH